MKKIFEIWFHKRGGKPTKCISLLSYRESWKGHPKFSIRDNGARRKNGDTCFDFTIQFIYLDFNYTNWDLQKRWK